MKVEKKGHITIIKETEGDITAFVMKVTHEYKSFESDNLILDISMHGALTLKEIKTLIPLAKTHNKNKKSFVIVANANFNSVPDQLVLVPTVQEAHDIIEMEEIERDLGF